MAKGPKQKSPRGIKIHPTANIEQGVRIGSGTAVWDHVHIRTNTTIGHDCIIGEKTYIAYDVRIGNYVKINAFVYIPTGVYIEDKVMIAAGALFVNDKFPRAYDEKFKGLACSEPNAATLKTYIREGATIGAGAIVLGGLEVGRSSMVGAGSVVTRSVPDHSLVVGNPAKRVGWVCVCGNRLPEGKTIVRCLPCGKRYQLSRQGPRLSL